MLTATIEFVSDTKQHLRAIEQQLRQISHVKVSLVEPLVQTAPALITIDIHGDNGTVAQEVAQALYDALRGSSGEQGQKQISLVTIEGDRVNIEPMSVEEITNILLEAEEGE